MIKLKIYKIMTFLVYLLALSPLIVSNSVFFPYVSGKVLFMRLIISLVSVLFFVYLFLDQSIRETISSKIDILYKNRLFLSVCSYFFFFFLSTLLAVDRFSAFFGTIDRGEGLVGIIFFFAFFVFTTLLFQKKEWIWFFKISLFSGIILFVYQLVQIYQGSWAVSFVGNQAYLAAYFLFTALAGGVVYLFPETKNKFWSIMAVIVVVLSLVGILLANTRSVFLGLAVAIFTSLFYLLFTKKKWRRFLVIGITALVVFSGVFLFTKNASVWQKIPVFNKLSQISSADDSTFARIYHIKTAIRSINPRENGYKKFLFGWGPEGYLIASNKYYDPNAYNLYEGALYDRVHNQVLDVFVAYGLFGLLSYLAIWFFIFSFIFLGSLNNFSDSVNKQLYLREVLVFFSVTYFIQNLFSFDTVVTYISFFALLSFVIFLQLKLPNKDD